MNARFKKITNAVLLCLLFISACSSNPPKLIPQPTASPSNSQIANPASVNCTSKGYKLEIRTALDGGQYGVCLFPDGSECEEWAFFRDQCAPGTKVPSAYPAPNSGDPTTYPAPADAAPVVDQQTRDKAVETVRNMLASQLKIDASTINLVSLEAINWPDSCLEIAKQGEMCAQVVTPGFRMILSVDGDNYTYHTDLTASNIREETAGTHGI